MQMGLMQAGGLARFRPSGPCLTIWLGLYCLTFSSCAGDFSASGKAELNGDMIDAALARMATLLRYNGEDRATGEYHYHGQTALLDNVQAAVLDVKLRHLPDWIAHRRRIGARRRPDDHHGARPHPARR